MTNDLDDKSKPSQQLVMTPQLQLAIKMLSTPSAELAALIASTQGLEPAELGDPDLLQVPSDEELELQVETGVTPWSFLLERPPELAASDADVWIFGNPPIARANRSAWPHVRGATRDAAWVVRALRQRAKLFEQVVTAILQARPELAVARGPIKPVSVRAISEHLTIHEATMRRAVSACCIQNLHGAFRFDVTKRGVTTSANMLQ